MPDFSTFREWLDWVTRDSPDLDLQPHQRLLGLPVRIVEDPVDPRVGYIFDERALHPVFPEPTMPVIHISTPSGGWWDEMMRMRMHPRAYQPLYVDSPEVEFIPPGPTPEEVARWEDDGGA